MLINPARERILNTTSMNTVTSISNQIIPLTKPRIMKLTSLFIICLLANSALLPTQNRYVISGNVTDEKRASVNTGNVYLLNASDSVIVKYALLTEGRFTFDPIAAGDYLIRISSSTHQYPNISIHTS